MYGARGAGNLTVCGRYGKNAHIRLLSCKACKARFSERKGTALFRSNLAPEKAVSVLQHLAEGNGTRQTGWLVGVHRDTVTRLARAAGVHARAAHDELVAFPPQTREVQLDEKWSFVATKQHPCDPDDPADDHQGDWWDHVAYDAEHRWVLAIVPGARSIENAEEAVREVHDRTDVLLTSDAYPAYESAIEHVYGLPDPPRPPGAPGRRPVIPKRRVPPDLPYATVPKEREKGRVVAIVTAVVLGTWRAVAGALAGSRASRAVTTSFVERHHGTDRHHNARKARRTYRFSKDWRVHESMTSFTAYSSNFCWPVRTLRERDEQNQWRKRTPAMAAGLADHVWSLVEWLTFPAVQ